MGDRSRRWYQPHLSSSYTSSYAGPDWPGHEQPSFINNVKTYSTAVNIMSILVHCIILFCQEFWIYANLFSKLSVACVQNCQKYEFISLNKQINYFSSKHVPLLNQLCSNPSGCVKCIGCHHHQILSTKAELPLPRIVLWGHIDSEDTFIIPTFRDGEIWRGCSLQTWKLGFVWWWRSHYCILRLPNSENSY